MPLVLGIWFHKTDLHLRGDFTFDGLSKNRFVRKDNNGNDISYNISTVSDSSREDPVFSL
jgi:hypothetical protein